MIKKGTTVQSLDKKHEYVVDSVISAGTAQGDIYKVFCGEDAYAMKIFHNGEKKKLLKQFDLLIGRGKICPAYVYPKEIVEAEGKVGYVMEYVDGEAFVNSAALYNGVKQKGRNVELPFEKKLTILYNIVDAFRQLYEADLCVADIKFDNIKVNLATGDIKILDVDTIVYKGSKTFVSGTFGFMPPLTMTGKETPSKYNDSYALAVIIFMTLLGSHPLIGRQAEINGNATNEYLLGEHPVYIFHPSDSTNRPVGANEYGQNQQRAIDRMKKYPPYFGKAMERTFVDGLFEKEKRTTPREWGEIIEKLYEDSFICLNCGEEVFFSSGRKRCDVCGAEIVMPVCLRCESHTVPLYNGGIVRSKAIFGGDADEEVFRVKVSPYDGKYGLLNCSPDVCMLKLKTMSKEFGQGEIIPIFLDGTILMGKHEIKFLGE